MQSCLVVILLAAAMISVHLRETKGTGEQGRKDKEQREREREASFVIFSDSGEIYLSFVELAILRFGY